MIWKRISTKCIPVWELLNEERNDSSATPQASFMFFKATPAFRIVKIRGMYLLVAVRVVFAWLELP